METRRLNEQVKQNADRFPEDFMFQLSLEEFEILKSQFAISTPRRGGRREGLLGKESEDGVHLRIQSLNLRDICEHHLGGRDLPGADEARKCARGLEDEIVHCCLLSGAYGGLRSYPLSSSRRTASPISSST